MIFLQFKAEPNKVYTLTQMIVFKLSCSAEITDRLTEVVADRLVHLNLYKPFGRQFGHNIRVTEIFIFFDSGSIVGCLLQRNNAN